MYLTHSLKIAWMEAELLACHGLATGAARYLSVLARISQVVVVLIHGVKLMLAVYAIPVVNTCL